MSNRFYLLVFLRPFLLSNEHDFVLQNTVSRPQLCVCVCVCETNMFYYSTTHQRWTHESLSLLIRSISPEIQTRMFIFI